MSTAVAGEGSEYIVPLIVSSEPGDSVCEAMMKFPDTEVARAGSKVETTVDGVGRAEVSPLITTAVPEGAREYIVPWTSRAELGESVCPAMMISGV